MTERKPKEYEESCENCLQNGFALYGRNTKEPIFRAEIESMVGDADRDLVLGIVARGVESPGQGFWEPFGSWAESKLKE